MTTNTTPNRSRLRTAAVLGALLSIAALFPGSAKADDTTAGPGDTTATAPKAKTVRLEEIVVNADRTSAETMAPVESRLDAVQPQSSIGLQTIQNNLPPTSDYALIANLAPSMAMGNTNGPGLNESKLTLRGLADGFYNITFDGIPFGDGNDYTHHTTSYFPAKLVGQETIDRGPGTAATIGMATFGGTVALTSKDPASTASIIPTVSYGSWNTNLENLEANSGILANGGSLWTGYQYMSSDGYRTFGTLARNTYATKYLQPVGKNATVTVYGTYNNIKFNNPNLTTMTLAQIATLGRNFGQVNYLDPSGNDYMRNHQEKHADLEYIGYDADLADGWTLHEKIYTFDYNNTSHESPNTTSGPTKNDFGGQVKVNVVRAYGSYLQVEHEDSVGTLKTGIWYDYQHGPRYNYYYDYNNPAAGPVVQNNFLDVNHTGSNNGYAWNMHFWTNTFDPYIDYAWNIDPKLTFDIGAKYMNVDRRIWGPVNQDKEVSPFSYKHNFSEPLPLAELNYKITPDWSAYAQVAQGFLTPALAESSVANPQLNATQIQRTTNYQVGTVYKTSRLNADLDGYWINYTNYPYTAINPAEIPGTPGYDSNDVLYYFADGAYYYGLEAEATYYVANGLSVFANGSVNKAQFLGSKTAIPNVDHSTAMFGFTYDYSGFNTSIIAKYIGPYDTYSALPSNPSLPLPATNITAIQGGYTLFDYSLSYAKKLPPGYFIKSIKAHLQVTNLFNRNVLLLKSPNAVIANEAYTVLVPRGVFFTVTGEF
jgi:iron complex outermembrane recepter protein